jgi:hypothetical protein
MNTHTKMSMTRKTRVVYRNDKSLTFMKKIYRRRERHANKAALQRDGDEYVFAPCRMTEWWA